MCICICTCNLFSVSYMKDGQKEEGPYDEEIRPGSELTASRLSSTLDPINGNNLPPKVTEVDSGQEVLIKMCK